MPIARAAEMKGGAAAMKVVVAGCVSDIPDWRNATVRRPDRRARPRLTVRDRSSICSICLSGTASDPTRGVRDPPAFPKHPIHQGCNRSCAYCIRAVDRARRASRPPA